MRILYFSYAYPNAASPNLGSFNRSLLSALAEQHEVRVVSPVSFVDAWRGRFRGVSPLDTSFSAIPNVPTDYVSFYYPPKILRDRFGDFLWWSVQKQLNRTIQEFRPDVIVSYWAHPDGEVAVRAGQKWGIPVVTMVGGSDVLLLARQGRRRSAILNVLNQADAVVAVSQNIKDTLLADGLPAEKVHVVRRGIDHQLFCPGDRLQARRELNLKAQRFTMVTVGRLVPVKGQTHLIRACAELHHEGHSFACYVLGNGPLLSTLTQEIQAFGLRNIVHLCGAQPQQELANWYRAADVTLLPSLSEGVPNVLLESIGCGTPFIATDVGGISEIADPRFDILVLPADPHALANAIRQKLLAKPTTDSTQNPSVARRFVSQSWSESAEALCDVFRGLGLGVPSVKQNRDTRLVLPVWAKPLGCVEAK